MSDDITELPPAKKAKVEEESENYPEESYGTHVTPEEMEKLRQFQVLDEVKSDDEDSNDEGSNKSSSDELPEEEIEKMLEEDLPEDFKGVPKQKEKKYVKREKIVLEEKGVNHFEVLPLDWMMVRHASGMPVYMHRASRVCTLSKPYFLGKGNTRRHDIPISAIPCLAYRIALKEEEKQTEIDRQIAEQIENGTWAQNDNQAANNNENQASKTNCNTENNLHTEAATKTTNHTNIPANNIPEGTTENHKETDNSISVNNVGILMNNLNNTDCNITNGEIANHINQTTHSDNIVNNDDNCHTENSQDSETMCPFKRKMKEETNSVDSMEQDRQPEDNVIEVLTETGPERAASAARPVVLPGGRVMRPPRVETVSTSWKTQQLAPRQLNDYCKRLFKFKEVYIMHFKRWADRRRYTKARKTLQYPTLPEGTKLITIPAQESTGENGGKSAKRDWVMNMNGCSYLSVFHEYVRRALRNQPVYEFKQLENATSPYQATVYIGGMQYGVGRGSSKRQAKSAAARASIHILIPEMRDELPSTAADLHHTKDEPDFSFFDYVTIEDPRIQEFCGAAAEPSPHAILRTCLLRNFGAGDRHIHTEMKKLEFQKIELTMKVGKHSATVVCKNKKMAKQRASQAILQKLHPHITSWGSLLRLYGSRSMKSCKEKKLEEQQITLLQDKARHNSPNHAVLEKLRDEMAKLREREKAVLPIGTLRLPHAPSHSASDLNNVQL